MNEGLGKGVCPKCGREIRRRVFQYELGRRGSMPYRMLGSWWHLDDLTPVCEEPADG